MLAESTMFAGLVHLLSHNWALTSIAGSIVLVVFIFALVIGKYVRIALNMLQEVPLPLSMKVRDFRPIRGDDVEFWATDGLRLRGTICLRPNTNEPSRGMIVFAPEFRADRESMARYCRGLWESGYDLFTFDFRGHGESADESNYTPRQWCSQHEVADATGAFTFIEEWLRNEGRPVEYGLFGISRGACAGVLAAAQRDTVKAIVMDGVFSSDRILEQLLRRYAEIFASVEVLYRNHPPEFWSFLRWCVFAAYRRRYGCVFPSVQKSISRMIPRPTLFIHGERDSYIRESQARLLYAVAPQPRYLWVVPDAKHNQSAVLYPVEYARYTIEFFDHFLAGRSSPRNLYAARPLAELMREPAEFLAARQPEQAQPEPAQAAVP